MVIIKAPTKHGLDRKFKPWRRGKSEKSNKRSSLKQQLRGIERLMQKLPEEEKSKDQRDELQKKMVVLKQEIDVKQNVIQEKKHADKAHGQRFLDRQRVCVGNSNCDSSADCAPDGIGKTHIAFLFDLL
jgi:hypothetical protein